MFDLVVSHGGNQERGWWDKIRPYSRGRATRERAKARSFGLVNVADPSGVLLRCVWLHTHGRGCHHPAVDPERRLGPVREMSSERNDAMSRDGDS